jgi:transposase
MKKSKQNLGLQRQVKEIPLAERHEMIKEHLSGIRKTEVWYRHTGHLLEHGHLLRWMRMYGYVENIQNPTFAYMKRRTEQKPADCLIEENQLNNKIKKLEKELEEANLRSYALSTMIDVAEKELKINIRKKSDTKQSK